MRSVEVHQEVAGITRASEQHDVTERPRATQRGGRVRGGGTKGRSHRGREGARSNAGRIQDDTTTPQNHNHNAAPNRRRQLGEVQMKN